MKLPKLHLLCGSSDIRPAIQNIKIEGNRAIATDGSCLVVYNSLHDHFDKDLLKFIDGKMIHSSVWKIICECEFFSVTSDQFSCMYKGTWLAFPYLTQYEGDYPKWGNVYPDKRGEVVAEKYSFNAKYFRLLSTAMRNPDLQVRIVGKKVGSFPIHFKDSTDNNDFEGIIMPINHANDY